MKPQQGDTVRYVGKLGLQCPRAAIVTVDWDTLDPRGVDAGDVPGLDSEQHVHLWVFTPNATGGFAEFNVPPGDGPGQWSPRTKTVTVQFTSPDDDLINALRRVVKRDRGGDV